MQGKKDQKLAKRLADELEWVRSNAKGRQAKSKARLARYEEMASEADRTRKLDFEEIQIPPGPRLGSIVVEAKKLEKGFDGRDLIEGLSFTLPPNGIVGVIGPNGVGKTTLIKTIVGLEQIDGGELKVGETVQISYVDQNRGGIDPNKTLWEVVSDGLDIITVGKVEIPSRAYVSKFGFKGPDQQKKAGVLSGGERNRLNLALTLKQGGNLLLLDEPTNDLDVETLGSLENALLEFPGCAVVITHDRWFLDRIATHILAYEGTEAEPAKWYWFEGNFEAYEENKIERLGPDAAKPHRSVYRKLTREADMTRLHVPIQLRWGDLDAYGHVNNAEMLHLLEEARIAAFWTEDDGTRRRRDGRARRAPRIRNAHPDRPAGDRVPRAGAVPAPAARHPDVARPARRGEHRGLLRGLLAGGRRTAGDLRARRDHDRAGGCRHRASAPDRRPRAHGLGALPRGTDRLPPQRLGGLRFVVRDHRSRRALLVRRRSEGRDQHADQGDDAPERLHRIERLAQQHRERVADRGDRGDRDPGDGRRQPLGAVVEQHQRRRRDDQAEVEHAADPADPLRHPRESGRQPRRRATAA